MVGLILFTSSGVLRSWGVEVERNPGECESSDEAKQPRDDNAANDVR